MSVKLIIYISVLAILCTYNNAIAQDYNFIVKRYTIEDGLSHRAVNFILQASDGFIWIGTDQGLNRFDGYDFKFWTKTDNGLLNDQINFIYEDPDKLLWLFSHNSYNSEVEIFDPSTEKSISFIKKFKSKLPYPNVQLTEYHVIDKSGAIYIGTTNPTGILKYHPKTGFKQILTKEGYVFGPEIYTGKNTIWGKFYTFSTLPENANEVEMDLNGHILNDIGKKAYIKQDNNKSFSEDGSFYYEKQPIVNGLIQTWHHDKDNHEIHLSRNDYFRDTYQLFPLWTYLKDKKLLANEKSIEIVKTGEKIFEFSDYLPEFKRQGIKTWFIDRSGLLWIGYDLGICCLEIQENQFKNFLFNGNNHSYGIPCRNIMPMKDGTVRVNTETYGQWSINWKTGKAEQINYYPSALYYGFGKDNLNNLYYSTSTSTIERFSLDKSKKQYHWIGADIWSFYNYKNQQMFMGPSNKGIMLFDFKTESVKPYTKYNGYDELTSATIYYFKEDKIGNIWACAETGLYEINPIKGVVGRYWSGGTGKNYLPSDYILHFYLDQENIFWLATSGGGLIKWDKEKGIATRFGRKSGLPVETIYGVYEDKHKHLWLPSQFGIIQFDKRKGEVRRIFGLANGITQEEFNRISHAMDSNGILYFGGLNGITSFNPESFYGQSNVKNAPLVIAECQKFDGNSGKIVDISADVIKKKYIELLPSDKYFTINVALLSYFETAKIQYAYRFDNENDWQFQKDRILRFSNLTYGDKKLHIKAQGADGIWSANELLLTINQLRPFYYQWWFILIIIMTLLGLLRWRLWSLNKRQKQLEEEIFKATEHIEKQAEELRHLDEVKSRFFANVSHELRTPLTLILGPITTLLKRNLLYDQNLKLLSLAHQQSKHLLGLIKEILDLSKLESKKLELFESVVNLKSLVSRIFASFESHAERLGVQYVLNYKPDPNLVLMLDPNKMETIIKNLISNALKYTPSGGKLTIEVEMIMDDIIIAVRDTGSGISPGDIDFVFDRFYQSKLPNTLAAGGTGIGLALCKELIELMQGTIWVESELGSGSTFYVKLPIKEIGEQAEYLYENYSEDENFERNDDIIEEIPIASNFNGNTKEKALLLVVEDNKSLSEFLYLILSVNYEVVIKENGAVALKWLEEFNLKQKPELIISDIMMPLMDGIEFLNIIKTNNHFRQIPVIMLTAKAEANDKLNALRIGIDDYMLKPFDEEELMLRVKNLIENYQIRKKYTLNEAINISDIEEKGIGSHYINLEQKLENYIIENLSNANLSSNQIADSFSMNKAEFQKLVKKLTGMTPAAYLDEVRFNKARIHLETNPGIQIKEVAFIFGFKKAKDFTDSYYKHYGKYPSEYHEY